MRAAICNRYGPPEVIKIQNVAAPIPKPNAVLIQTCAAAVNSGDSRIRGFDMPRGMGILARLFLGISRPRKPILGTDCAGVIAEIGHNVTQFRVGDEVIATLGVNTGTHAEYVTLSESAAIARKPVSLNMAEGTSFLFGGLTALSYLRDKANVQRGQHVLINGASGAVGCAAIQIAKHLGADVTAVCSARNRDLVRSLGANAVINYVAEEVLRDGDRYDFIMDNVGNLPWGIAKHSLNSAGCLLGVSADLFEMIRAPFVSQKSGKRYIVGLADTGPEILGSLICLVESGALSVVIDKTYPFDEIVDAYSRVDSKRKRGSVVILFG